MLRPGPVIGYVESDYGRIPIVPIKEKSDAGWTIECPYCGHDHTHGPDYGHRLAHCWIDEAEKINDRGYILERDE